MGPETTPATTNMLLLSIMGGGSNGGLLRTRDLRSKARDFGLEYVVVLDFV